MTNGTTVDDIFAAADETRDELVKLDKQLQTEIREIDRRDFLSGGDPTPEAAALRQDRRGKQKKVREAFGDLAFDTLQQASGSQEVRDLTDQMTAINNGLKDDLDELKRIEGYAKTAAKVADGVAKVVGKLASLAAGAGSPIR